MRQHYTTSHRPFPYRVPLFARIKIVLVTLIGWVFAWRPSIAMRLRRLIWRLLPWLQEASR